MKRTKFLSILGTLAIIGSVALTATACSSGGNRLGPQFGPNNKGGVNLVQLMKGYADKKLRYNTEDLYKSLYGDGTLASQIVEWNIAHAEFKNWSGDENYLDEMSQTILFNQYYDQMFQSAASNITNPWSNFDQTISKDHYSIYETKDWHTKGDAFISCDGTNTPKDYSHSTDLICKMIGNQEIAWKTTDLTSKNGQYVWKTSSTSAAFDNYFNFSNSDKNAKGPGTGTESFAEFMNAFKERYHFYYNVKKLSMAKTFLLMAYLSENAFRKNNQSGYEFNINSYLGQGYQKDWNVTLPTTKDRVKSWMPNYYMAWGSWYKLQDAARETGQTNTTVLDGPNYYSWASPIDKNEQTIAAKYSDAATPEITAKTKAHQTDNESLDTSSPWFNVFNDQTNRDKANWIDKSDITKAYTTDDFGWSEGYLGSYINSKWVGGLGGSSSSVSATASSNTNTAPNSNEETAIKAAATKYASGTFFTKYQSRASTNPQVAYWWDGDYPKNPSEFDQNKLAAFSYTLPVNIMDLLGTTQITAGQAPKFTPTLTVNKDGQTTSKVSIGSQYITTWETLNNAPNAPVDNQPPSEFTGAYGSKDQLQYTHSQSIISGLSHSQKWQIIWKMEYALATTYIGNTSSNSQLSDMFKEYLPDYGITAKTIYETALYKLFKNYL